MAYPTKSRASRVRVLTLSDIAEGIEVAGFAVDTEAARRWIRMVLRWAERYHGVIA